MLELNNLSTIEVNEILIKKLIQQVLKEEKKQGNVSAAFIGPLRMRKLNKSFRKKNRATDVLSFAEAEVPFEKFKIGKLKKTEDLGELVVCLREVKKNARRQNISFKEELNRVLIHGVLHLLGYDHEGSKEQALKMREKENYYINGLTN